MKTAFAKKMNIDPDRIFALSIMPCVAKKDEREKPLFHGEFAGHGVDCVLTTRELDRLIRADHIDPKTLKDAAVDTPFTEGTGAGVIFGATGGVMEAALRSAYYLITGKNPEVDAFKQIRGVNKNGWTEAQFEIAGNTINIAVVSGLQLSLIHISLGYGQSVTGGYISALNRQVQLTDKTMTLIQTDAAINPGNSGGALLNSKGELIGINTVKYSSEDVEGMGYAIPINTAKPIINKLIKNEATSESEQAYLGVSGQTIDSSMASQFDMPSGVYVQQVIKSSPAQKAGISAGDVIVSFNGSNVSTMDGLKEKISNLKAGKKVKVVVKRQNQMGTYEKKTLTVTLGKKSDAPSTSSNSSNSNSNNSNSYNNNYNNESSNSQYYSFGQ